MIKINLGCGPHIINGWVNYDIEPHAGVTRLDLSQGKIPQRDGSVYFIFSEHFLEHISKKQAVALLKECYRVLAPEGVLRFSTPDLMYLVNNYKAWSQSLPMSSIPEVWKPSSACDMVNEGMRLWGHQYLWDKNELVTILSEIGFASGWDCQWRKSIHEPLQNLEVRPYHGEIIIEVRKEALELY